MKPDSSPAENLWVKVKNFGPLEQAEVELRPLTIFLGPSNTGKSYLAMLVHTLHRFFSRRAAAPYRYGADLFLDVPQPTTRAHPTRGYRALSKADRHVFERWLSQAILPESPVAETEQLWHGMNPIVRSSWANDCADGERLESLLRRNFGIGGIKDFIRSGSRGGSRVSVSNIEPANQAVAEYSMTRSRSNLTTELSVLPTSSFLPPARELNRFTNLIGDMQLHARDGETMRELSMAYNRLLLIASTPFDLLRRRSHYLPADRSGMMHTRELVVSVMFEATDGRADVQTPALPGVVRDFLVNLLYTHRQSSRPAPYDEYARELEAVLLGGEIQEQHAEGTGFPHFFYRPRGWEDDLGIPMLNTSSMVSELAPVVLYLRRIVRRNQLLIIEEPESHLHPEAQAELAVHLAKLVNQGLRVLLTTHSEWLLEQFSNVVQLSDLTRSHRKQVESYYPSIEGAALERNEVGVWAFDPPKKGGGSTVQEIKLANDHGGMPEQYERVMRRLYNQWQYVGRHIEQKAA